MCITIAITITGKFRIFNYYLTSIRPKNSVFIIMETTIPYDSETINLQKDDVIVLFTDGISEAMNKEFQEFSDERLEKHCIKLADLSAKEILDGIKNEVTDFTKGTSQSDDITMVVLKVK